jgi:uncharacterized protein (TIGR03435 family)
MRRSVLAAAAAIAAVVAPVASQSLEFEVASIKRNMSNTFAGGPPSIPASGQLSMTNVPLQTLVLAGYPLQTIPVLVIGLPPWATSERYDVVAKGKPGATQEERQQMWRALLTERLKLEAHYEMRERAGYNLVFARADKRLGPQLQPSTLDCSLRRADNFDSATADSAEAMAMSRCPPMVITESGGQGIYSGGTTLATLIRMLSGGAGQFIIDRPVVDQTGLEGNYAVRLKFATVVLPRGVSTLGTPPPLQERPSIFTAFQEQLGLKLEPMTMQAQVLVVDHVERPAEN